MGEKLGRRGARLLLGLPVVLGLAAAVAAAPSAAPSADPLNPVLKQVHGPFRANLGGRDASRDPSPNYSDAERRQLVAEGRALFVSTTAWGQQPSEGPMVRGQVLSCAVCHVGPGFADGLTHDVGPVRERELGRRQTPTLFGLAGTAPYRWDGRNPTLQEPSDGTILGSHTPTLLGARFTAPYFHDGSGGDPTAPSNFLGGGLGTDATRGDIGASGPRAARRALLDGVLPLYNTVRFQFGFTQDELRDLAEFILSL